MAPSAVQQPESYLPVKVIEKGKPEHSSQELVELEIDGENQISLFLRTFRCLIADLCEQFKGGHPGYGLIPSYI